MEYMIRWKRTSKNQWYYLPRVFNELTEPSAFVAKKANDLYRCEVVALHPQVLKEAPHEPAEEPEPFLPETAAPAATPTAAVQSAAVVAKIQEARRRSRNNL